MGPRVLFASGMAVMVVVEAWLFPAGLATTALSLVPVLVLPRLLGPRLLGQDQDPVGFGEGREALPQPFGPKTA